MPPNGCVKRMKSMDKEKVKRDKTRKEKVWIESEESEKVMRDNEKRN